MNEIQSDSVSQGTQSGPDHTVESGESHAPTGQGHARIVVAVDTSRSSLAALEEAATLAALMHAELESLFVEDINLLHLCGFPFCNQIGSYTATVRRIDNRAMERELRGMAARLRAETARVAQAMQVPWRFHVRRGPVVNEVLDAAQSALFLGLGRAGLSRRKSLGSTAQAIVARTTRPLLILGETRHTQPPLVVVYTPDAAGERSLELALQLAPRYNHQLEVWLLASLPDAGEPMDMDGAEAAAGEALAGRAEAYQALHDAELAADIIRLETPGALLRRLQNPERALGGRPSAYTIVLPAGRVALMAHHDGPTLLVP